MIARYATAAAFRAALDDRLRHSASTGGLSIVRARKTIVFDRMLARLLAAAPDRWVLKGGVALEFRLGTRARTTLDLDLAHRLGIDAIIADLMSAASIDMNDGFSFVIDRLSQQDVDGLGTVRFRARASLGGRVFDTVTIDIGMGMGIGIGIGDHRTGEADLVAGPDLLAFAGIPPVAVPALPVSQHLAEKIHACTRTYEGGRRSSRVRDLIDIVLLAGAMPITETDLANALSATFAQRNTHPLPATLPAPPPEWATPYRTLANEVGIAPAISDGFQIASRLCDPVLAGTCTGQTWDPARLGWHLKHT